MCGRDDKVPANEFKSGKNVFAVSIRVLVDIVVVAMLVVAEKCPVHQHIFGLNFRQVVGLKSALETT